MLLNQLLRNLIQIGEFTLIDPEGRTHVFKGARSGPSVTVRVKDVATARHIFFHPNLALGEAFMDGNLTLEKGDVYELLELCMMNMAWGEGEHWPQRIMSRLGRWNRRIAQHNPIGRAQSNGAHH